MAEVKVVTDKAVTENPVRENTVAKPAETAARPFENVFGAGFPLSLEPIRNFFGTNPFAPMREFSREFERMMGPGVFGTEMKAWAPVVDVQRSDGNLEVTAELPGLKKEEVKVEMTADALIIHGERKREMKEEKEGYHRFERSYGNFYRAIPLPEGIKRDAVKAELGDGVLKIHMPVAEAAKNVYAVPVEHAAAK